MAVGVYKTYVEGEILFASDLNASFLAIHNGGISLISPATGDLLMAANSLVLDSDGDTSFNGLIDDQVRLLLGSKLLYRWGNTASPVNGLLFDPGAAASDKTTISAFGDDTDISIDLVPKGAGSVRVNGVDISQDEDIILAAQIFGG